MSLPLKALALLNNVKGFFRVGLPGTGALLDVRSEGERSKDYHFAELVASVNPVEWTEKPESQWRKFPIFNQNGSGSCVAQTMAKLLGVLLFLKEGKYVHFSATHIYQRRSNKPSAGMAGVDAFNIARNGSTLEDLAPSQSLTDAKMDSYTVEAYKQKVGEIFKISNFVVLPTGNIDTIASVIQTTKKAVMVWFFFDINEWTSTPVIKNASLTVTSSSAARHSVTAVDFTLVNGKKALIIEDSWGPGHGLGGRRVITEDFFKSRNFFAAYATSFEFAPEQPPVQKYTFTKELRFIEWDTVTNKPKDRLLHEAQRLDVVALQNILKTEGVFPTDRDSTGYYGAVTAKAVLAFQRKYAIAPEAELQLLQGKLVGQKTIAKLNELS